MSAMPDNIVPFTLPKKPRIKEKDAPPDQRKVCIMPIRALTDERLTDGSVRILALVCSYCNRAGITWVSQKRLAEDMKTSRQNITNQLAKLREHGYVEIIRKGFRGERCNTLRVIFDPSITAEEAITMTSNKEDTRPPAIREEQERQASEQIDREGQARIAKLISQALKQPTKPKGYAMPAKGETRAVREVKEAMQKAQSKRSKSVEKTVDNHQSIGNRAVSNESSPEVSNESLHRQPIGHSGVSLNSEEHIVDKELKVMSKERVNKLNRVLGNLEVKDFDFLIDAGMKPEQVEDALDTLLPLFAAEGLKPASRVLTDSILQLHRDAR
jgi:Mn-dependent DtxR family transcriptional regulator